MTLVAATALVVLLAGALPILPPVQLTVAAPSVARLGLAALLAGTLAALLPQRRLAAVDAATAVRESR